MKIRNKLLASIASLALAGGVVVVTAAPASAHTPDASADCQTLTVNAVYYQTKPEQGTPTIPNPDYKPGTPGSPEQGTPTIPNPAYVAPWEETVNHPAEYETQVTLVEYVKQKIFWVDYKWFPVSAQPNENSGWCKTGNVKTEQVKVKDAWTETINHPAVGEPTIPNPDYKPAVDSTDPVGEPTIPNPDYKPADATPNTVTVTINGTVVESVKFGTSFSKTYNFANKYIPNEWSVEFVSWNGIGSKVINGTTTPCERPEQPKPNEVPGEWSTPVITCENEVGDEIPITRDVAVTEFVWDGAEWVEGESKTVQERDVYIVTEEDIEALECHVTPEEPTNPEQPEEPTTPQQPEEPKAEQPKQETPASVVVKASTSDTLAVTGSEGLNPYVPTLAALAVALGAASVTFEAIRRHRRKATEMVTED